MNITFNATKDEPVVIDIDVAEQFEDVKRFTLQITGEGIIIDAGDYTLARTFEELFDLIVDEEDARWKSRMNHPVYGDRDVDVWSAFNSKG